MPAPSLMTKPSRSFEIGLPAFCALLLFMLNAYNSLKPVISSGLIVVSAPPVMTMSADPLRIRSYPRPMAYAGEAQAVLTV